MLWNGDVGSCFESGHPFREAQARFVPQAVIVSL
jgi:hypothetical protein